MGLLTSNLPETNAIRRWHDRCNGDSWVVHSPWIVVDAIGGADDGTVSRKLKRMQDVTDHPAKVPPVSRPETPGPVTTAEDKLPVKPALKRYRAPVVCGDCEPGGFGSKYGFSPR